MSSAANPGKLVSTQSTFRISDSPSARRAKTVAAIDNILLNNFDMGRNARGRYGAGLYFSEKAQVAAGRTGPEWEAGGSGCGRDSQRGVDWQAC